MKDWIGYHNTEKVGTTYISLGESVLYSGVTTGTPKSGDRVWVIEGIGKKKMYRLVDCFIVDRCETTIDPLIKHKSKKIIGQKSLMNGRLPISFDSCTDKEILKPLYQYVQTSPSFTGADNKLEALKYLFNI